LCRIPNWWKHKTPGLRVNISLGNSKPSGLGMNGLIDFNAQLMLGSESMSVEEVKALMAESQGMALIKGKWIEIVPEKLQQTLDAYDRARQLMLEGNLTLREAMRMQLGADQAMDMGPDTVEFSHGQWLQAVMEKLSRPSRINRVLCPKGFKAELRAYQQQGLNWLIFLNSLRLGICLADDMGLGKTVQLLAMLTSLKAKNRGKTQKTNLLVLPASLIGNWINEINRFAPSLRVFLAHPSGKAPKQALQKGPSLNKVDLVITTYALCQRYDWLNRVNWNLIILDEAQAIKNPGTKQTRAVKLFKSINRIAMTGTPIENRLSDLWSLFDFLNPGLLGTVKEFTRFTKTLRDNPAGYSRLKKVISPYILRRLKTDKSVISDLPDKVEMKTYTQLSKKQILLYQSLVQQLEQSLEAKPDGIQRKGLVLAMLSKFKQICNHPDQYTGQQAFSETHSGKFQRLRSLCDVIVDKREQVLIFTQFKEIIAPLANTLETAFGYKGLTLHGSTAVKKRKQIVEQFQSDSYTPFMILSIKAGGVGLNLTAANHVIHFDRWWNPAVENQATDRAFRIGQHKNVVVHKFITQGTIEEKIDKMLEDKAQLSDQVIGRSSEQWITEMDNEKLMSLFTLSL
jgi:SNF2 family DNA or RNA helicase